ncbi:MAG TPA: succinate dehydrogenase/fumarate reductase iron-sulfur subunit [Thermoanaerobaculia bacterium]|nr:succinate dehydrogenase/fumarate reductase iron-sulfur subunit [Thermoanaerobaculia bacterium]
MNLKLRIWRQAGPAAEGRFVDYELADVSPDVSFLEMLDMLNEQLAQRGEQPVAFDQDCREGICGSCSMMIGGVAHGPRKLTATCQLHMRSFRDGDTIVIEPWRARAFPVLKDLVVDRGAFDRIIQAGGYVSVATGEAPEANAVPVPKPQSDAAFDAASCIACGACVAQCPNGAAHLFTSAKVAHLGLLPQGQPERYQRAVNMVEQMEAEGFGACTNYRECEAVCPKGISIDWIARMNRDYLKAKIQGIERIAVKV